ncbi:hypothetical protein FRB90_005294 [Tulasnella sp. 427]|nr:hypothetical protein FRB90_005294 [Tulasnella sp. 427]
MLSIRSSHALSFHIDNPALPVSDTDHSETDCPTETENETPPDSPVRPLAGQTSNAKPVVDIVQATSALSLLPNSEPISRRSTPEVYDDPGYVAEGETHGCVFGKPRIKKNFPSPDGPIWLRRRANSHSRSPSPRGLTGRSQEATPVHSRSVSPVSGLGSNFGTPRTAARRLAPSPLVAPASPPAFLDRVSERILDQGVLSPPPSPSPRDTKLDTDLALGLPLPPRPVISPEKTPPNDLDIQSPLELPESRFIIFCKLEQHISSQVRVPASPSPPPSLLAVVETSVHSTTTSTPSALPLPSTPPPKSTPPSRHTLGTRQLIPRHLLSPQIKTPPGLLSIGTPVIPRQSFSLLHPRLSGTPPPRSRTPLPSPFTASLLGRGLRRVPQDAIPPAGTETSTRDGNGVYPPDWFVARPLSPATALVAGVEEPNAQAATPSRLARRKDFNPYFSSAPNSL